MDKEFEDYEISTDVSDNNNVDNLDNSSVDVESDNIIEDAMSAFSDKNFRKISKYLRILATALFFVACLLQVVDHILPNEYFAFNRFVYWSTVVFCGISAALLMISVIIAKVFKAK